MEPTSVLLLPMVNILIEQRRFKSKIIAREAQAYGVRVYPAMISAVGEAVELCPTYLRRSTRHFLMLRLTRSRPFLQMPILTLSSRTFGALPTCLSRTIGCSFWSIDHGTRPGSNPASEPGLGKGRSCRGSRRCYRVKA